MADKHGGIGEAFLTIHDTPVYFSEDWNAGIGGGLWSTGLAMAKYFERHSDDVAVNLKRLASVRKDPSRRCDGGGAEDEDEDSDGRGISALELGSGNGFLSVCLLAVAAHLGIPLYELVATDMSDHLDLMARTLKANPHVWDRLTILRAGDNGVANEEFDGSLSETRRDNNQQQPRSTKVLVAEHLWGEFEPATSSMQSDIMTNRKYDFIFGSDLAYRNSLHKPLISSLVKFSHRHTLCLIGVTMTDTQPVFFDLLTEAGFRYEKLADHLLEREFRGSNFGIIAIQKFA
jgi:predicted nicotinamide N-methyase